MAAIVFLNKKKLFSLFVEKPDFTKFVIKQVKVNPGSYFEQTIMGQIPKCYIPAILEVCPLVPAKKNFKRFFTI